MRLAPNTAALLCGALGIAVSAENGCGTSDPMSRSGLSVYVAELVAHPMTTPGTACTYNSDPTQPSITSGTLDIALTQKYTAVYLVAFEGPLEGGTYSLNGLEVRITKEDGSTLASYGDAVTAAALVPSGKSLVYIPAEVTLINTHTVESDPDVQRIAALPLGSSMRTRLLTYIRFNYSGAGSGLTAEFSFPVDVCNGCLISFTDDPSSPSPNCIVSASSPPMPATVPCSLGQDAPVDCRLCQSLPACAGISPAGVDGG
jgi:hypothetical protein